MNYHKPGLKKLLNDLFADRIGRLVSSHKGRRLRFGAFTICQTKQVAIVILNPGEDTAFGEPTHPGRKRFTCLVRSDREPEAWRSVPEDALEIMTAFLTRPDGRAAKGPMQRCLRCPWRKPRTGNCW